jgi:hypothetical protein
MLFVPKGAVHVEDEGVGVGEVLHEANLANMPERIKLHS